MNSSKDIPRRRSRFDDPPSRSRATSGFSATIKQSSIAPVTQLPPNLSKQVDKDITITLDTCPVGIMASILNQKKVESMESGKRFVPYQPIQTDITPPSSIVIESINEIDNNRINDFYDELEELMDRYRDEIDPNDRSFDYSKRKQYNTHKQLSLPIKIIQDPVISQNHGRFSMGTGLVPEQIRATRSFGGNQSTDHAGLGSISDIAGTDVFENYRRKRANEYHEHLAIRGAVRRDPSCIVITSSELCYSCNRPGHYAKDCKYGLT